MTDQPFTSRTSPVTRTPTDFSKVHDKIAEIVSAIADNTPSQTLRLRQGNIVSCQADGTATVTIAGSSTQYTGIPVASHVCPVAGATCWLATDGRDWFVMNTLAPKGPAYGSMRKSTAQSIPNAAFTELGWGTRTESVSNGITLGSTGLTIVVPGLYQVTAAAAFVSNSTGNRHAQLLVNGTVVMEGTSYSGSQVTRMHADAVVKCAQGDVINVAVYQNSGAALNTDVGAGSNVLRAVWIGPSA